MRDWQDRPVFIRRRRQNHAADHAARELLHNALLQIRTMAYLRRDSSDPTADYIERIRMIADICHHLPGSLGSGRSRTDIPPFLYMWMTASVAQRSWLREQWTRMGYDFSDLERRPGGGAWTFGDVFPNPTGPAANQRSKHDL